MKKSDRLYELLPVVYRQRDADQGYPLRALLQVIAEQVDVVEDDIAQLNENWFIETCEDWVVPYIGDLIGYRQVHEAGEPGDPRRPQVRALNKILIPRRDVANTIGYRRRKGTLALLELLADNVAGWPARAVEFYKLIDWTQHLNHQRPHRGRTVDLRDGDALDLLDGSFDNLAHTVEVRQINSQRTQGRYNIPSAGLFVWRLKPYSVTQTPAYCVEEEGPHCYTFSVLGNDTPLYNRPQPESDPTHIAEELDLPTPIRRRSFENRVMKDGRLDHTEASGDYYGADKSLAVWVPDWPHKDAPQPIPKEVIIPADLSGWSYRPDRNFVAADPVLGRIAFPADQRPKEGVRVWYHYAFSADIGGGEYDRQLSQAADAKLYRVRQREDQDQGEDGTYPTINSALNKWAEDKKSLRQNVNENERLKPISAVIEITDSGAYTEPLGVTLEVNESLQVRAAKRARPVIRLLDYMADQPDAFSISGAKGSRFMLDGILATGRGLQVRTLEAATDTQSLTSIGDICDVTIRHCTFVPGWGLHCDCQPHRPSEPSLELLDTTAHIKIEHSILGAIYVVAAEQQADPVCIHISDSIWDATSNNLAALNGAESSMAYVRLTIARSTVFGQVMAHEIALAENCIFKGRICVARRQKGCVRFCYVPPDSRTPRRYECQPDLVLKAVQEKFARGDISPAERDAEVASEQLRVEPEFNSTRYGTSTYCQLADSCADEIKRGADDESEMGAFHDLFQPQRVANLRARLDEYTPAGSDAGIIYAI
jgi:hypothetical protein